MKSVGYDIYDIWDLGEFNYGGMVRTKYGTMKELVELAKTAKEHDVVIYIDAVLNHKFGADDKERFKVREVDNDDRTRFITGLYEIEVGMLYTIPNGCLIFNICNRVVPSLPSNRGRSQLLQNRPGKISSTASSNGTSITLRSAF